MPVMCSFFFHSYPHWFPRNYLREGCQDVFFLQFSYETDVINNKIQRNRPKNIYQFCANGKIWMSQKMCYMYKHEHEVTMLQLGRGCSTELVPSVIFSSSLCFLISFKSKISTLRGPYPQKITKLIFFCFYWSINM